MTALQLRELERKVETLERKVSALERDLAFVAKVANSLGGGPGVGADRLTPSELERLDQIKRELD